MHSHPTILTGKSKVPLAERRFRSELECQILEIQEAFRAFVSDEERHRHEAEGRFREIERQKQEAEDQLREAARQLRKLQRSLPVRIMRFFKKLHPVRSVQKRMR